MAAKRILFICIIAIALQTAPAYADQVHFVAPGETLSGIAKLYGISLDSLIGNNQYIINPDRIFPNQVIIVPGVNQQAYVVKPGDTLSQISKTFNVPINMLASINDINDVNLLYIGQVLMIPKIYTVKPNDTLTSISKNLGVTLEDLILENNLNEAEPIYIGQRLVIPFRFINREELADVERELSPLARRFPGTYFYKGEAGDLKIALTFDDGPNIPGTNDILDILKNNRAKGTFFLLGRNIMGNTDIVDRIIKEGHTVANHSMNHRDLRELTFEEIADEMLATEDEIYNATGLRTALMRPPYGFTNNRVIEELQDLNYKIIEWSADTNDWRHKDVEQVLIDAMPNIRDGAIILMHDAYPVTREALPLIIHSLKSQGYELVTVNELLDVPPYK